MRRILSVLLIGVAAVLLLASSVIGQVDSSAAAARPERTHGRFSLGGGIGVFQPVGSWADHRYAPVDQFTTGLALELIAEYEIADWAGIAAEFGGSGLGTDKWVNYAASRQNYITSSARTYYFAVLFRPYLLNRARSILKMDVGGGIFNPSGEETYLVFAYDYDFLQSKFLFVTGLEYCLFVKPRFALAGRVGFFMVNEGVEYADGLKRTITGFPATVGLRFYP